MLLLLSFILACASASAFFFASPHQQMLSLRHVARLRRLAWLLLVLAWGVAWRVQGLWGGGFAMLSAFMLTAASWPYLNAYSRVRGQRYSQVAGKRVGS